jgi:hypothetical protein
MNTTRQTNNVLTPLRFALDPRHARHLSRREILLPLAMGATSARGSRARSRRCVTLFLFIASLTIAYELTRWAWGPAPERARNRGGPEAAIASSRDRRRGDEGPARASARDDDDDEEEEEAERVSEFESSGGVVLGAGGGDATSGGASFASAFVDAEDEDVDERIRIRIV